MKKDIQAFLNAYKELEAVLKETENTPTVFDYEVESTDNEECEKLKVCRIARNYLQHHVDGEEFVGATPAMTEFLKEETAKIQATLDSCKQHTKKVTCVTEDTTLGEAIQIFAKSKYDTVPVIKDGKLIGVLSASAVIRIVAKTDDMDASLLKNTPKKDIATEFCLIDGHEPYSKYRCSNVPVFVKTAKPTNDTVQRLV